ncbi:MAG: DHH family phosphoesterase [Deltaproteobacteria bacterium]|jgi:phosphoesterase RecJ-like protein|nr:DHH family phosphoesterase [Deltaproteobacteria bacterium]
MISPTKRASLPFREKLLQAKHVLVMGHNNPDGDALGSGLALVLALRELGKAADLGFTGVVPPNLYFLLENSGTYLDSPEPQAISGYDLLVYVDCHDFSRVWPEHEFCQGNHFPPYLVIDHHVLTDTLSIALDSYHDHTASSTGELMSRLLTDLSITFTPTIVEALLTAIASDTGFYTQTNASPSALRETAYLVSLGGDLGEINAKVNKDWSLARLRLLGLALGSLELSHGGQVATMLITRKMFHEAQAGLGETDGFIEYPRSIQGVTLAALIKSNLKGQVKVSMRSRGIGIARSIAMEFGGGGHDQAAAYSVGSDDISGVKADFLTVAGKYVLQKFNSQASSRK